MLLQDYAGSTVILMELIPSPAGKQPAEAQMAEDLFYPYFAVMLCCQQVGCAGLRPGQHRG